MLNHAKRVVIGLVMVAVVIPVLVLAEWITELIGMTDTNSEGDDNV